ncbi:MAG: TonB family protein [Candidatus Gastranaerophilales bacterium]|nr:TonB family protein [Candidatus Gastranaerophilales bacterium]
MMKKVVLLFVFVINFMFVQNNVFAQEQFPQDFYLDRIQKKVGLNWLEPLNSSGKSAILSFSVNQNGTVSNMQVFRSSGDVHFDESVVAAVYKAAPFEQFPNQKKVNIQFFFSPILLSITPVSDKEQSNIVNVADKNVYIDFSEYTDNLQNKINANWKPKKSKKDLTAIANITISQDGSLDKFSILKSSRSRKFDRSVLDAISNSVPMDTFPAWVKAPCTDVQLTFNRKYNKNDKNAVYDHYVDANVMNVVGYDKYIGEVERILADYFKGKRYFFHKDVIAEVKINREGKLRYAKLTKPSKDKNFNRKVLAILQTTSFPPIPQSIPFDSVTLNYEILTQKGNSLRDFVCDYMIFGFTTELKSFGVLMN